MEQLSSLEQALANAYKNAPHLPRGLRVWLVENAWWLVIIGVVLSSITLLAMLPAMFVGTALVTMYAGSAYGGPMMFSNLVNVAVLVVTIIIEAMAIQPLKVKQKRGWNLLFLASVVGILGSLIGAFITYNIVGGILWTAVAAILSFYVLFELRGHYLAGKKSPVEKQ